jgi:hypothetical protein
LCWHDCATIQKPAPTPPGDGPREKRQDVRRYLKRVIARQLFKLLERLDRPGVELANIW